MNINGPARPSRSQFLHPAARAPGDRPPRPYQLIGVLNSQRTHGFHCGGCTAQQPHRHEPDQPVRADRPACTPASKDASARPLAEHPASVPAAPPTRSPSPPPSLLSARPVPVQAGNPATDRPLRSPATRLSLHCPEPVPLDPLANSPNSTRRRRAHLRGTRFRYTAVAIAPPRPPLPITPLNRIEQRPDHDLLQVLRCATQHARGGPTSIV